MSDRVESRKDSLKTESTSAVNLIKDTRHQTNIPIFLDFPLRTAPFGHNISAENLFKRAERIAAAVYMLTGHIPAAEPARIAARNECIALLEHVLHLRGELRAPSSEHFKNAQASTRKIISLVRLLGLSGHVSLQNSQILVESLDEMGNLMMMSQRTTLAEEIVLTRDELTPRASTPEVRDKAVRHKVERARTMPQPPLKDRIKDASISNGQIISGRSDRIMDILRSGGTLGIKDIVSNLPEYSEKMVQRELAVLVRAGKVRKTGAKRWSRYSVA